MTIPQRIESIRKKLEQIKKQDPELKVFGAGDNPWYNIIGHHYEMRPVLKEEQLKETEKLLDVKLPEEYREFLKQLGDGGAGPGWGMFELSNTHPDAEFFSEYPDFCSMEFPYDNEYAKNILDAIRRDYELRGPFDDPFGGYIKLANYGHDMNAILVVSGEQYGKMWLLDENASITPFFQDKPGREAGVGFLDWFENWLDETLVPGARPSQF